MELAPIEGTCPKCLGKGCAECNNGKATFRFGKGDIYTQHCTNSECGFNNGGRIDFDPKRPPSAWKPPGPCLHCGGETVWRLVGVSE